MGSDTEAADDIDRGDMAPAVMPDSYGYDIDQMTMTTKKRNTTVTRTYEDMKVVAEQTNIYGQEKRQNWTDLTTVN
ncbi:unnamed protein product [Nippostrongylus brasiliensis]|uniref:Reverse transcriptase domain-containing protein n=1 Tax=Nippostrongylus brasiliensis TaxID=27835 RepID=A0A0N4YMM7_NIPBR|nr:unnamed protein product [Nippostrongylus brasiliensis]